MIVLMLSIETSASRLPARIDFKTGLRRDPPNQELERHKRETKSYKITMIVVIYQTTC